MRRIAFTATLLLVGSANAQTLYKCVSHAGTSYQQVPCPSGARIARVIETTPEPPPSPAQLAQRERQARAESTYLSHLAGTDRAVSGRSAARSSRQDPADRRCEAAKAQRARRLERAGLKRTFDLLRQLDEDVAAACKRR